MKLKNSYLLNLPVLLFIILCQNSFAAINDVIPSDYEPPLANSTVMSLNYLSKELNINLLPKNQYIKQNTYALR